MADFVQNLVEMGFSKDKAEKAVQVTGNVGVEPAMEWILNHPDEPATSKTEASSNDNPAAPVDEASDSKTAEVVRSYKCDDCGKQFRNAEDMEVHAAKTSHSNFSESTEEKKPLTAEEREEQLKRIEEKMKQKRAEREEREKKEEIEREKVRVKSGKELAEAKRRIEEQEMKEIAEARRREKIEDRQARERVKAKIEEDKIARKARMAGLTAVDSVPSSSSLQQTQSAASTVATPTTNAVTQKKEYKETKIQLRLPNGTTLTQTFGANEPLASVRLYVELHRNDGLTGNFNLMKSFPKRVFEGDDYDIPLQTLDLVPSAVLMVTKPI